MITDADKVKILDFGLAKALSDETQSVDSSQSPTLTEAMTRPGVILGTAAYMSPEQAKGKSVDKRADIWAFGCILYERLTLSIVRFDASNAKACNSPFGDRMEKPFLPHSRALKRFLYKFGSGFG
jgi:serine/threonine protein kinase